MSGIAGILRRDGREVPEKWVNRLEQSILLSGNIPLKFEDSIPIQSGNLSLTLLGSDAGADMQVLDGTSSGEYAQATWNQETLELALSRRGTGQKSLYWLDLGEAGDGLVFCSNPLPLLQICYECALPKKAFLQGVQEYLQLGIVIEGGALLAPICSIPLHTTPIEKIAGVHTIQCDVSPNISEDVIKLVQILGKPFGDITLLSKLWQYRAAKYNGDAVLEGLKNAETNKKSISELLQQSHFLKRVRPPSEVTQLHNEHYDEAKRIELATIAGHVGVEIEVSKERIEIQPVEIPLASWLRNSQSSLGQLAGDMLSSTDSFDGLPIEHAQVMGLFDRHRNASNDYSELLFSILTLVLWHQLVRA